MNRLVVSDGGAVSFILNFAYLNLTMTDNITAAAAASLNAGCDLNSGGFERALNPLHCDGCTPNMTGYGTLPSLATNHSLHSNPPH